MHDLNPMLYLDGYKTSHKEMYPDNTTLVYSNFTPRSSRVEGVDYMILFGVQYLIKEYLIDRFNKNFFQKPKDLILKEYKEIMDSYLGKDKLDISHIEELHDLGYLPILIKALPEGTKVPMGVPALTIVNTHPRFFWLTNYLETLISCIIWKTCTSATTASQFYKNFKKYAKETSDQDWFVNFQGHDFSFRGMSSVEDGCSSGAAHLLFFDGTDTVPSISFLEKYYGADKTKELVGCSVPAGEHSTQCASAIDYADDINYIEEEFDESIGQWIVKQTFKIRPLDD